jgi:hypothetical protein
MIEAQRAALARIESHIAIVRQQGEALLMDEALVKAALTKIDDATTQIAANLSTVATTTSTISTEVDALQTALAAALANGTGVTQALVDQATAIGDKATTASDALTALVPVLQGIATKGVSNPVPLPVPAPAPDPDPLA